MKMNTMARKMRSAYASCALGVVLGAALLGSLGSFSVAATAQETPNDALPPAIDADAARLELLVAALRGGQVTVEEAQQRGDLSADDVIEILATRLNDWGGFEWGKDEVGLRRALAKVLAEHGGERLKQENLGKLPPKVRLWLADYFQSIKDPRTVEIAESVLGELKKTPILDENALEFQAMERLAWFYEAIGDDKKRTETWSRLSERSKEHTWQKYDALFQLLMARFRANPGDKETFNLLKASLESSDNVYLQSALNGIVTIMLTRGNLDQVLALLNDKSVIDNPHLSTRSLALCLRGKVALLQGHEEQAKIDWQKAASLIENSPAGSNEWSLSREILQVGFEALSLFRDAPFLIQKDCIQLNSQQQPAGLIEVISLRQREISLSTSQKGVRFESGVWQLKTGSSCYVKNIKVYLDSAIPVDDFTISIRDKATGRTEDVSVEVLQETGISPDDDFEVW